MSRVAVLRPTASVVILAAMLQSAGCNRTPDASAGDRGHVVPVEVAVAHRTDLVVARTYSGTLEGEEQANIFPKLSERITALPVKVGDVVRPGQTIVNLDRGGATSQYLQAEASYRNAEKTLARMKSLYAEGAISLQTLDGTQTAFDVAKANFDGARSLVDLSTPISGVVTALNASIGDLASPGTLLATVARIQRLKVTFSVHEADVPGVRIGQKVEVTAESGGTGTVTGEIIQRSTSADVRSRSFDIKALLPNTRDFWFKPGMFVKVRLTFSPRTQALVIPAAALQSDGVSSRVYLCREGRAYQRAVETGATDGEQTEVLRGLAEGDTVVTVGVTSLRDSIGVRIVRQPQ
jgi:membrane fusion protein (multidrug efflux system)